MRGLPGRRISSEQNKHQINAAPQLFIIHGKIIRYLTGEAVVPLTSAPHLDHIHVYEGSSEAKGDVASFPYHVDNGLFLIITPSEEQPLLVKDVNGKVLKADNGEERRWDG